MQNYFISCLPENYCSGWREKTGDFDYSLKIAKLLQNEKPDLHVEFLDLNAQQTIDKCLAVANSGEEVYFHLMLNPPGTGMGISADNLSQLKQHPNIKIVITIIEVARHLNRDKNSSFLMFNSILERSKHADHLIFLDENDRNTAKKVLLLCYKKEIGEQINITDEQIKILLKKASDATIIPVPTTTPIFDLPLAERGNDILVFGVIRKGKGFGYVTGLAKNIKNTGAKFKIHIVGSILQDLEVQKGELKRLIIDIYPRLKSDIEQYLLHNIDAKEQDLLSWFLARRDNLSAELPIELHFNVEAENLACIIQKCKFAWYPAYRGATLRNSSLSSLIANQCIVLSHATSYTPQALLKKELFGNSLLLCPDYCVSYEPYPAWVLEQINNMVKVPDLAASQLAKQNILYQTLLSDIAISKLHAKAFATIETNNSLLNQEQVRAAELENKYGHRWLNSYRARQAERKIFTASHIDIKSAINSNMAALEAEFVDNPLTAAEQKFLDLMLDCVWNIQHVSAKGQEIIDSGKIMSGDALLAAGIGQPDHTPANLGQTSLIFLTLAPTDQPPIPDFLTYEQSNTVFYFDYNHAAMEWPDAYIAGHWYAFQSLQNQDPIRIGDTIILVRYRVPDTSDISSAIKYIDIIDLKSEQRHTIESPIEKELFKLKDASKALTLKLIQILRKFDRATYEDFFSVNSLSNAEKGINIFNKIFHSGYLEVHKTWQIKLENWSTHAVMPKNKSEHKIANDLVIRSEITAEDALKIILKQTDFKLAQDAQSDRADCNYVKIRFNKFIATVFSGDFDAVEQLIDRKDYCDFVWITGTIEDGKDTYVRRDLLSPFFAILCLTSVELCDFINQSLGYPAVKPNPELAERLYNSIINKNTDLLYPKFYDLVFAIMLARDINDHWILQYLRSPLFIKDRVPYTLFACQGYNSVLEKLFSVMDVNKITKIISEPLVDIDILEAYLVVNNQENIKLLNMLDLKLSPMCPLIAAVLVENIEFFELIKKIGVELTQNFTSSNHLFLNGISYPAWEKASIFTVAEMFDRPKMLQYLQDNFAQNTPASLQRFDFQQPKVQYHLAFYAVKITDQSGKNYFMLHDGVVNTPCISKNYLGMPVFGAGANVTIELAEARLQHMLPDNLFFNLGQINITSSDLVVNDTRVRFSLITATINNISQDQLQNCKRILRLLEDRKIHTINDRLSLEVWSAMLQNKIQMQDILDQFGPKFSVEYRSYMAIKDNDIETIRDLLQKGDLDRVLPIFASLDEFGAASNLVSDSIDLGHYEIAELLLEFGIDLPSTQWLAKHIRDKNKKPMEFFLQHCQYTDYFLLSQLERESVFEDQELVSIVINYIDRTNAWPQVLNNPGLVKRFFQLLAKCENEQLLQSKFLKLQQYYDDMLEMICMASKTVKESNDKEKFNFYLNLIKVCADSMQSGLFFESFKEISLLNGLTLACLFEEDFKPLLEVFGLVNKEDKVVDLAIKFCSSISRPYVFGVEKAFEQIDSFTVIENLIPILGYDKISDILVKYIRSKSSIFGEEKNVNNLEIDKIFNIACRYVGNISKEYRKELLESEYFKNFQTLVLKEYHVSEYFKNKIKDLLACISRTESLTQFKTNNLSANNAMAQEEELSLVPGKKVIQPL